MSSRDIDVNDIETKHEANVSAAKASLNARARRMLYLNEIIYKHGEQTAKMFIDAQRKRFDYAPEYVYTKIRISNDVAGGANHNELCDEIAVPYCKEVANFISMIGPYVESRGFASSNEIHCEFTKKPRPSVTDKAPKFDSFIPSGTINWT